MNWVKIAGITEGDATGSLSDGDAAGAVGEFRDGRDARPIQSRAIEG